METKSISSTDFAKLKQFLIQRVQRGSKEHGSPNLNAEQVRQLAAKELSAANLRLGSDTKERLFAEIAEALASYGPIQDLLDDPSVTEIMVNGPLSVYVERNGRVQKSSVQFKDDDEVQRLIQRIVKPLGREIDTKHPAVDARLPDGSRVNAVIPPAAIDGPSITIRKFFGERLGIRELVEFGSITEKMAEFLKACVRARLNIIISGGTGSGKTTLLNVLSSYIPEEERIVTIEDAAELQLQQDHVVRLETTPPDREGNVGMTVRELVRNSLRMRPDRIVVGEVRGSEALDMLQAMNTGHDGSMTTVHANSPRDAISRLETLVLMAGLDLPVLTARQQIAAAVDVIVQQSRLSDGSRKVTYVTEISGMEGETVVMTDIFRFEQKGTDGEGRVLGGLVPTGIRPLFTPRLKAAGFDLGASIYMGGS